MQFAGESTLLPLLFALIGNSQSIRRYVAGGVCTSQRRLDGKTVVITGANTGIGKETAVDMARRGARVIACSRSKERGEAAVREIKERTGSDVVVLQQLDLADLASIRDFAERVLKEESRIDVLINNAGVMMCPYEKTKDGFEMQFGVNHLGHFYLTHLLLDRLKTSAPSRIVNVASKAQRYHGTWYDGSIDFDDLNGEKSYDRARAYGQSKLANVLFTRELARRLNGTRVTAYSLHPGAILTELPRHLENIPVLGYLVKPLLFVFSFALKTPFEGAQTSICCAVDERLENVSGRYYSDCVEEPLLSHATNDTVTKKLWEVSERLTGIAP